MREITQQFRIIEKDESELTPDEQELLRAAKEATHRSYVPYSHFYVGAAARLDDGTIVTGCNQENCAYPSGLCAERTTLFYANAQYPDHAVTHLCIAARDTRCQFTKLPVTPCGACRQVMTETENRYNHPINIMLYGTQGIYFISSAKDLLPVCFDPSFLR